MYSFFRRKSVSHLCNDEEILALEFAGENPFLEDLAQHSFVPVALGRVKEPVARTQSNLNSFFELIRFPTLKNEEWSTKQMFNY